jgi:GDPmannose 4,6-dehydratase
VSRALITGVSGQDGGYLCERLVADGAEVHGVDRAGIDTDDHPWLDGVTLHKGDITDTAATARLIDQIEPDEVYNLAAVSSVALSWSQPVLTTRVNSLAVAGLLEAVYQLGERTGRPVRFVQASSAEIFGVACQVPQNEQTPITPANPYGAAKAFAHHLVGMYRLRGLHASTVICYGHESVRRPPTFVTRKITSTVAAIAAGRADELVLGSLDARRDWGWAPEYVEAMVLAARHHDPGDYVLATGRAHAVAEFVEAAFTRVGISDWQRYVRSDPAFVRPADPGLQVGDATRARDVLGWTPRVVFPEVAHLMVDADLAALG